MAKIDKAKIPPINQNPCPKCGSTNVKRESCSHIGGKRCLNCGHLWDTWID